MRFSTDKQIGEALIRILTYADLRKHLADDEHHEPLPIYGCARWHDRVPLARIIPDGKERLLDARNNMTYADHLCMEDRRINNEEGC